MRSVALISPGDMGQAVGALLASGGVRVLTCLAGRSERTRVLARTAGFTDVPTLDVLVRESELLLSIVPPAQALAVARDVAAALRATGAHLTYVDCNAIAPRTAREVAAIIAPTRGAFVDAAFTCDYRGFEFRGRIIEVDRHKALPRRLFQVFQDRLITRIIRNDKHEIRRRFQYRSSFFNRKTATMIGERMNDNDRVFARFDNFVEIADRAVTHRGGQRPVVPDSLFAFDQKAADQISR